MPPGKVVRESCEKDRNDFSCFVLQKLDIVSFKKKVKIFWIMLKSTKIANYCTFIACLIASYYCLYRMGRLCGGAHEISGIKAPLFLCGWVGWVDSCEVGGFVGGEGWGGQWVVRGGGGWVYIYIVQYT